jgi:hypothetical protein
MSQNMGKRQVAGVPRVSRQMDRARRGVAGAGPAVTDWADA